MTTRIMPLLRSFCPDDELTAIMTAFRAQHGAESAMLYARFAADFTSTEPELLGV
jgi:hypothetical protein